MTLTREQGYANTDRELWREREGDYYADSIHVTESGAIGINCGGHVIVLPVRKWHAFALKGLEQNSAAQARPRAAPAEPNVAGHGWITGTADVDAMNAAAYAAPSSPPHAGSDHGRTVNSSEQTAAGGDSLHNRRFLFIEQTDGGMDHFFINGEDGFEQVGGWMESGCEQDDESLLAWSRAATAGDFFHHRIGIAVCLKPSLATAIISDAAIDAAKEIE